MAWGTPVPADLRYVVAAAFVVLLYASVLVHELSHSVVARGFGLPVRRILLYPLGGFSEIESEPPTPAGSSWSPRRARHSPWRWRPPASCWTGCSTQVAWPVPC